MASEVGIINAALQLIKNTKRISARDQGTKEANAADEIFDEMRDLLLDMHTWNFASTRVKMSRLVATPAFEWDYQYEMPADLIRVVRASNNSTGRDRVPHVIEAGKLLADAQDIYLLYIARVEDPNQMPPTFRNALSKLLASRFAVAIAQSTSLAKEMHTQFIDDDLPTAKSVDALQGTPEQLPESTWVTSRYGGGEYYEPGEPNA